MSLTEVIDNPPLGPDTTFEVVGTRGGIVKGHRTFFRLDMALYAFDEMMKDLEGQ